MRGCSGASGLGVDGHANRQSSNLSAPSTTTNTPLPSQRPPSPPPPTPSHPCPIIHPMAAGRGGQGLSATARTPPSTAATPAAAPAGAGGGQPALRPPRGLHPLPHLVPRPCPAALPPTVALPSWPYRGGRPRPPRLSRRGAVQRCVEGGGGRNFATPPARRCCLLPLPLPLHPTRHSAPHTPPTLPLSTACLGRG